MPKPRPRVSNTLRLRVLAWLLGLALIGAVWCLLNLNEIGQYRRHDARRDQLRQQVTDLERETKQIEQRRDVLVRGGFESEKVARERFRLSKPDEHVLYLTPPEADEATTPSLAPPAETTSER